MPALSPTTDTAATAQDTPHQPWLVTPDTNPGQLDRPEKEVGRVEGLRWIADMCRACTGRR